MYDGADMWRIVVFVLVICVGIGAYNFYQERLRSVVRPDVEGIFVEINTPTNNPLNIPSLNLGQIFSSDHSWVKTMPSERVVTIIATGDVIPARSVNQGMVRRNNFLWPFEKTAEALRSGDFTVINLETSLITGCVATIDGMSFCGDPKAVEGIKFAGVDIATLGNNHIGNYGETGVKETEKILHDAGIETVGTNILYKDAKGIRFAFLAYNDIGSPEAGVPWAEDAKIITDIKEAKHNADIVIVSYHWGVEYNDMPSQRQVDLAHITIDAGADVILGNHPHWIQPVELYKDKFIVYAHGNFIFDQEWSVETKLGVVGKYTFYDKKLVDVEFVPIRIVDYGQPYLLSGEDAKNMLGRMKDLSLQLIQNTDGQ